MDGKIRRYEQTQKNRRPKDDGKNGRAGEIRTRDLLHPMQARYQATLRPETRER